MPYHAVAVSVTYCVRQLPSQVPLHFLVFVSVGVTGHPSTGPAGTVVVRSKMQSGVTQCISSSGHLLDAVRVQVGQGRMWEGAAVIEGVVDERQDDDAVSVVVYVAHPCRHAVSHGRYEVVVGVAEHRLFGPGMVVALCIVSAPVERERDSKWTAYLSNTHCGTMHGFVGAKGVHAGSET